MRPTSDNGNLDKKESSEHQFYKKAQDYWRKVAPTIDGVLGGFGHVSVTDINGSEKFLRSVFQLENPPKTERAIDCGAGIGRITRELLINHFSKVDLIDQNENFVDKAREHIGKTDRLGSLYAQGLQDFEPEHKYDVIWCQWVLGHLTDSDFIKFMTKCRQTLAENGVIVVKENVTSTPEVEVDEVDSSVTRPLENLVSLLEKSGLMVVKTQDQMGFPKSLFPVKMLALRPNSNINS